MAGKKFRYTIASVSRLVLDMALAAEFLDQLPEDREFTSDDIEAINDLAMASSQLSYKAEAVLDVFHGKQARKPRS